MSSIVSFATSTGITWTFNPPAAPWWGGFYERLVQITKRCLVRILFKARVTLDELITIVAEVESVLNDRPLTYVTSEIGDEIITPNHLNYGRRLNVNPSSEENNDVSSHVRYKYVNELMNNLWTRFNTDYLSELRERHKLTSKRQSRELINVEDVVLIKDDKLSRSKWKIGVVESVQLSKDEQIRVATVRTRSNGKNLLLKRAVNLLYPVET